MSEINISLKDDRKLELIGDALSSPIRRKILNLLVHRSYSVLELSKANDVALSTMSFHLKILKEAGLIKMISSPNKRGNEKNVSKPCRGIHINLVSDDFSKKGTYTFDLPIGSYVNFDISPPCSMFSRDSQIGELDTPSNFYLPQRMDAQLISFFSGYLEYRISNQKIKDEKVKSFMFSLELCSECPNYNHQWKSDITFWINDIEVCTYRSPGDFGNRRGMLNPAWYQEQLTQYGLLKKITIDNDGTWLDNELISPIKVNELELNKKDYISLKLGVKSNSHYVGGINLFGKEFGDHNQNIEIQIALDNNE